MGSKNDNLSKVRSEYMKQLDPLIKYISTASFGVCLLMGVNAVLAFKLTLIPMLIHRMAGFKRVEQMHSRYNEGDLSDSETRCYKRLCLLQIVFVGWGLGWLVFVLFYYTVYVVLTR